MFGVIGGLITLAFLYLTKFCVLVVMQVNCNSRVQPPELAALVSQTDALYMLYTCMYKQRNYARQIHTCTCTPKAEQ